jgi:hypothetical protein
MPRRYVLSFCLAFFFCASASAELADPTQPTEPLFSDESSAGLQLEAILYTAGNPVAVVGDRILHTNESINGYSVIRIYPQSVELLSPDGEKITLRIDALKVKKPHVY